MSRLSSTLAKIKAAQWEVAANVERRRVRELEEKLLATVDASEDGA